MSDAQGGDGPEVSAWARSRRAARKALDALRPAAARRAEYEAEQHQQLLMLLEGALRG